MCSLCDTALEENDSIQEFDCTKSGDLARSAYALALTAPEEALRLLYEAFQLARQQTALYGACTRDRVADRVAEGQSPS